MNNKKWAKHIIKRFGKAGAVKFTVYGSDCPCQALDWFCVMCKYKKKKYKSDDTMCKKSKKFWKERIKNTSCFVVGVKDSIIKRLNK